MIRWIWRRMAQRMEKRPRSEGGIREFPRTRTSRVPVFFTTLAMSS